LAPRQRAGGIRVAGRVSGKDVTAFTREMGALLSAAIPIPQALDGLGEEEENPALRVIVLKIADSVRKGAAFSAALDEHPKLFSKWSMMMNCAAKWWPRSPTRSSSFALAWSRWRSC
jgi:type II secretory pathway component PulF